MLAYSERERKWIRNLRVVEVDGKHACINTGTRVVKLQIATILLNVTNNDDNEVVSLLKEINIFSTGGPPKILIIEVLKPNNPRR